MKYSILIVALFLSMSARAAGMTDMAKFNPDDNSTTTNGLKGVKSSGFAPVARPDFIANGKVYKNHEITGCSADGVEINYDGGAATIALKDWPANYTGEITSKIRSKIALLQKKRDEAEKAEQATAVQKTKENKLSQNAQCLIFKVIGVENGALLGSMNAKDWYEKDSTSIQEKIKSVYGFTKYKKNLQEQNKVNSTASQLNKEEISLNQFAKEIDDSFSIVYITGIDTSEYIDDQQVVMAGIRSGTHKYISVNGAARTVPKFIAVKNKQ
ncbi:MAG: hypothetical protein WCI51_08325 [Lentisphaerota bacterium]